MLTVERSGLTRLSVKVLTVSIQEVAKPSKERYSPKTLHSIIAGIRRSLAEQKPSEDIISINVNGLAKNE